MALLSPSGCGKTTTLRCIAGLERPHAGEIRIDGRVVSSAAQGLHLYPESREIGMVFQSYAVWPHMTVFDNVGFGLRIRRADRARLRELTMKALDLVGLAHLADRYATKVSGGQCQRVALARAIAYSPKVILLDEPLSNLDAKLREQMRVELVRLQREVGITSIYVTHDQSEALVMSDRIVVMDQGLIQQIGAPQIIYARPANAFVAKFIGVANLLEASVLAHSGGTCELEIATGGERAPLHVYPASGNGLTRGQAIKLSLRSEDIELHVQPPADRSTVNVIEGEVIDTVYLGSFLDCQVRVGSHEIGVQIDHYEHLLPGQKVFLTFRPDYGLCLAQ